MKLIVGLGNPGAEYVGTRHNVGFEVIDELARRHNIVVTRRDYKSLLGEGVIAGERVTLVKPQTYMNLSGEAVAPIARFYKIAPEDVIVVLDDVALAVGRLRLRLKGSSGGQNGLNDLIRHLGTQEIPRIRLGVGGASGAGLVKHVLSKFRPEEKPLIADAILLAADAAECALREGFETAMNRFNISEKPPKPPKPEKPIPANETKATAEKSFRDE